MRNAPDFEQLEPERLDLSQNPVQRGLIPDSTPQQGVFAVRLSLQFSEGAQNGLPEVAANPNLVDHVIDRRAQQGERASPEPGEPRGAKI
jgi:hypothetical protein